MVEPIQSFLDKYPRLRRASVLILVAGGLVAWVLLKPHIPHDHPVAYRFDPDSSGVTGLEASWTRADSSEAVAGARYQWRAGEAPRELHTTVRGPDGDYTVEITVQSGSRQERSSTSVALGEHVARVRALTPLPAASASAAPSAPSASAPAR